MDKEDLYPLICTMLDSTETQSSRKNGPLLRDLHDDL